MTNKNASPITPKEFFKFRVIALSCGAIVVLLLLGTYFMMGPPKKGHARVELERQSIQRVSELFFRDRLAQNTIQKPIEILFQIPALRKAVKENKKDQMRIFTGGLFDLLKKEQAIREFYVIDDKHTVLLRSHDPEKFGDTISNLESKIELSEKGTRLISMTFPVNIGEASPIYIKYGVEADSLIRELNEQYLPQYQLNLVAHGTEFSIEHRPFEKRMPPFVKAILVSIVIVVVMFLIVFILLRNIKKRILAELAHLNLETEKLQEFCNVSEKHKRKLLCANHVIKDVVSSIEQNFRESKVKLEIDFHQNLPSFWGNQMKMENMIQNILMNAKEAFTTQNISHENPIEKKVKIATGITEDAKNIAITISDNGAGISEENIDKIFDPFFSTKNDQKHVGLGLSISYSIVKEHKGEIIVSSREGAGAIFRILIPIDARAHQE